MPNEAKTVMFEDAKIIWRNFSGEEKQYNRQGERNFAVVLDDETYETLLAEGWNAKRTKPRENDDGEMEPGTPHLPVKVGYKAKPPMVVLITSSGRTNLTKDTIGTLDWAEIRNVDLIVRAYEWDVNGKTGITAYLQSMYVTIEEDALMMKYGHAPVEG